MKKVILIPGAVSMMLSIASAAQKQTGMPILMLCHVKTLCVDPTCYSLESEVILNASQIAILKNKSIKKYRLDGYEEWVIHKNSTNSKLIFNEMLNTK